MVVPAEDAELAYGIIDYGAAEVPMRTEWLNNVKISDISCFSAEPAHPMTNISPRSAENNITKFSVDLDFNISNLQ